MFHLSRYYYSTISALQASVRVVRLTLHHPSRAAHLNLPIPAQLICIRGWCVAGLGAGAGRARAG